MMGSSCPSVLKSEGVHWSAAVPASFPLRSLQQLREVVHIEGRSNGCGSDRATPPAVLPEHSQDADYQDADSQDADSQRGRLTDS